MSALSEKATARALMSDAGLPVQPGSLGPLDSGTEAKEVADRIGYPVMIKAVAGGGGRGMRRVEDAADFLRAYADTRATSGALFGDSRVYVERFLPAARHVEVQVLADRYGTVVHLGERDCSVQRRNQKLLEETPAPAMSRRTAARLCDAAVRGVESVGYVGAGTVEFLYEPATESFTFMEINCRIQVEHPVTEMVTGVDLVREQLLIAAGEPVPTGTVARGAAVECRINAEDPAEGFRPAPGPLHRYELPMGPFTRVDALGPAVARVPSDYDPLVAKVVTWAPERDQALARMDRALGEVRVEGPRVRTTTDFLRAVLAHPDFRAGRHDTALVERMTRDGRWVP
jgi:acetyl-CoA carboxylase, biotin carboxylase subunit